MSPVQVTQEVAGLEFTPVPSPCPQRRQRSIRRDVTTLALLLLLFLNCVSSSFILCRHKLLLLDEKASRSSGPL